MGLNERNIGLIYFSFCFLFYIVSLKISCHLYPIKKIDREIGFLYIIFSRHGSTKGLNSHMKGIGSTLLLP